MVVNPEDIRILRQRLGWSVAEMARRMGCGSDLVTAWENGHQSPDPEVLNQMHYLESHLNAYSEKISHLPLAEQVMNDDRLSQLTHRDLLDRNNKE